MAQRRSPAFPNPWLRVAAGLLAGLGLAVVATPWVAGVDGPPFGIGVTLGLAVAGLGGLTWWALRRGHPGLASGSGGLAAALGLAGMSAALFLSPSVGPTYFWLNVALGIAVFFAGGALAWALSPAGRQGPERGGAGA